MSEKSNVVLVTAEDCDRKIKEYLAVLGLSEAEARDLISKSDDSWDAAEALTYARVNELYIAADELQHWLWLKDA